MTTPTDPALRRAMDALEPILRAAVNLLAQVEHTGSVNRDRAKIDYGKLLDAHMLATGVVGVALERTHLRPGNTTVSISHRLLLVAAFTQGINLTEIAITEGLYIQAAALLKQELEILAAIQEVYHGSRQDGKTPNVKGVPWHMARTYGDLNRGAHVADSALLRTVYTVPQMGDAKPVSLLPVHQKDTVRGLYALHVSFIVLLTLEIERLLKDLYGEGLTGAERLALRGAVAHLESEGFLEQAKVLDGAE